MTQKTDDENSQEDPALENELNDGPPQQMSEDSEPDIPEPGEEATSSAEATESPQEEQQEEPPEEASTEPEPVAKKKSGGVLVWLVLLLTLGALGGVGYLYYELIYKDHQAQLRAELANTAAASENQFGDLELTLTERMVALETRQEDALSRALEGFEERMGAAEEGFASSLNQVINTAPPSEREWKLAEAAYLLRVANHRLLMEGDVRTALSMLEATDQILAELDDFALHQVRAALADETMALKRVRGADVQGLYLTLEAIKNQLGTLPIAIPEYLAEEPPAISTPEDADVWQVITDRFFSLFSFREVGRDGVRPLLAPDEAVYLEQNIRLTIEQAQLAALKRHQDVYQASLSNAKAWVVAYLEGDSQDVQDFAAALDELLAVDLERPMPDISGSFSALNDVLRGVPGPSRAAPADEPITPASPEEAIKEAIEQPTTNVPDEVAEDGEDV